MFPFAPRKYARIFQHCIYLHHDVIMTHTMSSEMGRRFVGGAGVFPHKGCELVRKKSDNILELPGASIYVPYNLLRISDQFLAASYETTPWQRVPAA